jgi:hypothetical protein
MLRFGRTAVSLALTAVAGASLAACGGGSHPATPAASTASASPSATASPVPVAVKTCPLTGLPPKHGQDIKRVALAVKIDNVNDARPQAGLDRADLVVEETVEGGLTRLFTVFQCDSAADIGPIRSARTSDADLLRLLDGAVFGYSGANPRAIVPVQQNSRAVLIPWDNLPQYFHLDSSRPAPHDVFSSSKTLLGAGIARNHKLNAPRRVFVYGKPKRGGTKVKTVSLTWPAASASWTWTGKAWQRTQNGTSDVLRDGHRVSATNVVVMSIAVANSGLRDVLGNPSPDDVVTGSGHVWVLRNGHVIRGTWHRPNRASRMTLKDAAGNVLPLAPGRTWIELLPRPRTPGLH